MTDEGYDELSTKREMVRLLAKDATAEQLDAAINACMDSRLDDAERRSLLIQSIYRSWYERLGKRPRPAGVDVTATWEDVEQMFRDVLAMVGVPRPAAPGPLSRPAPLDQKSESQSMAPMASVGIPAHGDDARVLQHIRRALDEPPARPAFAGTNM